MIFSQKHSTNSVPALWRRLGAWVHSREREEKEGGGRGEEGSS